MLNIDCIGFVGSKKNRGGSEKNRLFGSSAELSYSSSSALLSVLNSLSIGSSVSSSSSSQTASSSVPSRALLMPQDLNDLVIKSTGISRSMLDPCSIDPPQLYLFTGRSLLSGRRVGERAVNHPGFVLRTDICFEWLVDTLIIIWGLKNWSEATVNYGNINVTSVK